jgi:hypothetical protein
MAFVPRKNKIVFEDSSIDKSSESKTLRKSQINSEELIDNLKYRDKTYLQMTIETLNILESQGIDIYDPNRKPGMYQRGKKGIEDVQKINVIKFLIFILFSFAISSYNSLSFEFNFFGIEILRLINKSHFLSLSIYFTQSQVILITVQT